MLLQERSPKSGAFQILGHRDGATPVILLVGMGGTSLGFYSEPCAYDLPVPVTGQFRPFLHVKPTLRRGRG